MTSDILRQQNARTRSDAQGTKADFKRRTPRCQRQGMREGSGIAPVEQQGGKGCGRFAGKASDVRHYFLCLTSTQRMGERFRSLCNSGAAIRDANRETLFIPMISVIFFMGN